MIKLYTTIVKLKMYQKKYDFSYTHGIFPTLSLFEKKRDQIIQILLNPTGERNEGFQELKKMCEKYKVPYDYSTKAIYRVSPKENTYAIGVFRKYESNIKPGANHVVLVNPSSTGNMGTVIRAMLGFGFKDLVIIKPAVDIFDPKVLRASMGAIFDINFKHYLNFDHYLQDYGKGRNIYCFRLDASEEITKVKFEKPFALVFGNESSGLGPYFDKVGKGVRIPHSKDIDSLNLAVSASIGMFYANNSLKSA